MSLSIVEALVDVTVELEEDAEAACVELSTAMLAPFVPDADALLRRAWMAEEARSR